MLNAPLPVRQEGMPGFPLPAEAWLEELLALVSRMLANLDAPETRSDLAAAAHGEGRNGTFLVESTSTYRCARTHVLHACKPGSIGSSRCHFIL
jgi:hypothetical protein